MKHIIIGTAGHIDHGKTTLIKAITGRETDRLKEEQERGISIELGFTYFDLPSGQRAGIIDVPGHEKFIKHMLAGVMGIDIVLLVVAADEGLMPQSLEHLAILDMAGIEEGIIVITKTDMVEDDWIDLVEEEVIDKVKGSFLENSPIVRVSSKTKEGISDLIDLIDQKKDSLGDKDTSDMARLPVDRVFSIPGFGTIVTGTLISGQLKLADEVQIFPSNTKARIRSLQVHDQDAKEAFGGQRVAINLAGVKKEEIERGNVIGPVDSMKASMMLDVKVKTLESYERSVENWDRLRLYLGTSEVLCRIVILDKDLINPGEEAYVQLRLEEEIVAKRGDKFILRSYSPMYTIGGGEILDPNPSKKKRFDEETLENLKIKEEGSSFLVLENIIKNSKKEYPSLIELAKSLSMLTEDVKGDLKTLEEDGRIILINLTKEAYPIHISHYREIQEAILRELSRFHKVYPLRKGMAKEELRSKFLKEAKPRLGDLIIDEILAEGLIKQDNEYISLKDFEVILRPEEEDLMKKILTIYKDYSYLPERKSEALAKLKAEDDLKDSIFNYILANKDLKKVEDDFYITKANYLKAIDLVRDYIETKGSISAGELRDLLSTNRRIAIGLLENFDQDKITKRTGDTRSLY